MFMNSKPRMQRYTLADFQREFPDTDTCLEWLKQRFNPDVEGKCFCVKCDRKTKHYKAAGRPSYCCEFCGNHYHPTAGTIFHKSPTPLPKWFYAIYLMAS